VWGVGWVGGQERWRDGKKMRKIERMRVIDQESCSIQFPYYIFTDFRFVFQIVLLTDGNAGVGAGSLSATLSKFAANDKKSPIPYPFPSRIHVISLLEPDDNTRQSYAKLVEMNYGHGQVRPGLEI
jgi:hypothetical protein